MTPRNRHPKGPPIQARCVPIGDRRNAHKLSGKGAMSSVEARSEDKPLETNR